MVQYSETPRMKSVVGMISQERFVMKLRSSGFLARLVQSRSSSLRASQHLDSTVATAAESYQSNSSSGERSGKLF